MAKPKTQVSMISELRVAKTNVVHQGKGSPRKVNLRRSVFALTTLILMLSALVYSEPKNSGNTTASVQLLLGRWDLTLKTPLRESPSWLEITQEGGQLKPRLVSRWGHPRPPPQVKSRDSCI